MTDVNHPTEGNVPVLATRLLSRNYGQMIVLREKASSRRWMASNFYVRDLEEWR